MSNVLLGISFHLARAIPPRKNYYCIIRHARRTPVYKLRGTFGTVVRGKPLLMICVVALFSYCCLWRALALKSYYCIAFLD